MGKARNLGPTLIDSAAARLPGGARASSKLKIVEDAVYVVDLAKRLGTGGVNAGHQGI